MGSAGNLGMAESAKFELSKPSAAFDQGLTGLAGSFLVPRAFASGCAALTGVEAISNGVPAFEKPQVPQRGHHAAPCWRVSISMIMAILLLARATGVLFADDPPTQLAINGLPVDESFVQHPGSSQHSPTVFQGARRAIDLVAIVSGPHPRPRGQHGVQRLPGAGLDPGARRVVSRQLHTRGDRLAFSNGIVTRGRRDAADRRLRGRGHPADPAVHRRGVRVVRVQPERDGPALEPAPAHRAGSADARGCSGRRVINTIGVILTGDGAGHRAADQVHPRRLDRDRRDAGRCSCIDEGDPPPLRPGRARSSRCGRRARPTLPSRVHAIVLVSQAAPADPAGARLRPGDPAARCSRR